MIPGPDLATATAGLEIRNVSKRFTGQLALDNVSLTVAPGEIRGLVGENGAGKSTLIKILAGIHDKDDGELRVAGHPLVRGGNSTAIAFVHQDLGLVDELTVGENVALTAGFPKTAGLIRWPGVWEQALAVYDQMGVEPPDPRSRVGHLSPADKALLGIVRALSLNSPLAVLDEPTASLPAGDVEYLLSALRRLRQSGTSILYVTHRLAELFAVADTVTVLRGGRAVADGTISDFTVDSLVEAMLGRSLEAAVRAPGAQTAAEQPPIIRVRDLRWEGGGPLSFTVQPGEVLGLVGLRGAGHEKVGQVLAGAMPATSGSLTLGEEQLDNRGSVAGRMRKGLVALPPDRQREAVFPGMSLLENLFPGRINSALGGAVLNPRRERRRAIDTLTRYDVRPLSWSATIDHLSGGNQQKVAVARVLDRDQRLVILDEPTAGVDVGSRFEIHQFVRKAAAAGTGIIVVSSDFEEMSTLCTRVLIIADGVITGELSGERITQDQMLILASADTAPHVRHAAP